MSGGYASLAIVFGVGTVAAMSFFHISLVLAMIVVAVGIIVVTPLAKWIP